MLLVVPCCLLMNECCMHHLGGWCTHVCLYLTALDMMEAMVMLVHQFKQEQNWDVVQDTKVK